jgi:hypothetical protein
MSKLNTTLTGGIPIKSIHTYQYVVFQGKSMSFFTESKELGLLNLTLEYYPTVNAVRIKTDKDEVLVFSTNIAYARPLNEATAASDELNRGKIKNNNPGDKLR